jgi:hydroxyacylglutathione hydrolase
MDLVALPAFTDNYIWMFHDGRQALVVDPGDAAPVTQALNAQGLELAGILVTHHHGDHTGGVDALRPRLTGRVFGPANENIPEPYERLRHGDRCEGLGLRFEVIDVPGHTSGHIAYYCDDAGPGQAPILFCGDTLFSAGCGRLFEGTAEQMHRSLQRLAALPGRTRVCCGHEYTLSNLRFAHCAEAGNAAIERHSHWCQAQRQRGMPTLPSSIEREREINPFLRCTVPAVVQSARAHGASSEEEPAVFAALRQWKNEFK